MPEATATARLFFALWPDTTLQDHLADWARRAAGSGRAMRRENIHLTLAFLGETPVGRIAELLELSRDIEFSPIHLELDRIGYWKHNRIVWCGAKTVPPALIDLVETLRERLDAANVEYDRKPFAPHLTLVRNAQAPQQAPPWVPQGWEARDFALVRSSRVEGRIRYEAVERFAAIFV